MDNAPHQLVIHLTDHFQFAPNGRGVPQRHWHRFTSRLSDTAERAIKILGRHGARATFAVDCWVAEQAPEVVARIARCGHEIAMAVAPGDALQPLQHALEAASGLGVNGAVLADGWRADHDTETPAALGLDYVIAGDADACPGVHVLSAPSYRSSGEWLRMLPRPLVDASLRAWTSADPQIFVCQLWELDPTVERLAIHGGLREQRAYRNLDAFSDRFEALLGRCRFLSVRDTLGLAVSEVERTEPVIAPAAAQRADLMCGTPVSIVVPCFNEEAGLEYLSNTIATLQDGFGQRHRLNFVLVDDGSADGTWAEMHRLFASDPAFTLVRHDDNRGICAAIQTGCDHAPDDVIAVIDSDCSYDPARIEDMLALLSPDVAMVTASPYHPQGGVDGVPEWRLFLSRGASWLYRGVLRNKLATYTSCFRVFRKSAIRDLQLSRDGYIGIVEMLVRLDFEGWRIVEYPVVLEARLIGHSKLRVPRVIAQHMSFLSEILLWRLSNKQPHEGARATR